jgi:hypothetical protein
VKAGSVIAGKQKCANCLSANLKFADGLPTTQAFAGSTPED